jgi:DNA-binding MarR family transcriptional regulator
MEQDPEGGFRAAGEPGRGEPVDELESALHTLFRVLKQARLHGFLLNRSGTELDRAGVELLYVLYPQTTSLRLTELAELLRIDAPAVSRKAQQLERCGLVGRDPDRADGRATRLRLTDPGRAVVDRILAARRDWLTAVLADWSAADQDEFARMVRRFAGDVDRHLEEHDVP